ncbi:MAG: DNA primase [Clostridia bacterium]|nr:DNA primase [Clostridia bacterium]
MAFPDSFMQDLKARSDIVDTVSSYVNLKRRGKNYLGLCPFHNEKTPSFNVNPDGGYFHCFGCGAGGDVITFIERIENLDYVEAVKLLAQRAGLQVPENNVDDSLSKLRLRIKEINRETARFYHSVLMSPEGRKGLEYFYGRGLSPQTIRHFGLGYAPENRFALVNHLKEKRYSESEMIQANVAFKGRSGGAVDRFYGRVMFPIIDLSGTVVAFGGRALGDEKPKYINTSDTPVYKKSHGLFAMNFAKNTTSGQLILAEGYMDVISLHAAGFTNAIASLGTALTPDQARIISKYAREVIICYDSDQAGQTAAQRAIPILRETGLNVRVMAVPGNKDPDEFIRSNGKDGPAMFRNLIENSGNDVEYQLQKLRIQYDLSTADGSVRFLTDACTVLANIENDIERNVYAGKLSSELNVDKSAILNQTSKLMKQKFRQYTKKQNQNRAKELSGINDNINTEKRRHLRAANAEENVIRFLMKHPDAKGRIENALKPEDFVTEFNRRVYRSIIGSIDRTGTVSLSDFSGEYTSEEMSAITKIIATEMASITLDDVNRNIEMIRAGGYSARAEDIKNFTDDQMIEYLNSLKNRKK